MEITKRCFKCGEVKPLSEFYRHSQMADGHLNKCKDCARKDTNQYKKDNPMKALKTRIKTCKKNPTHTNARRVVNAAVDAGVINRPDECQGCGRKATDTMLSAHHHDYTKPLDVIWLCAACHRPIDRIRAAVESGEDWNEFLKKKHYQSNFVRRAVKYYLEHVKTRNNSFDYDRFMEDESEIGGGEL